MRDDELVKRNTRTKEIQVFHIQPELVESIQRDRRREGQAARLNAARLNMLPDVPQTLHHRLFKAPSTITNWMRGTRTAMPRTSA
jgi:hypothetical protein